jgi:hypothetical protein
LRIVDGQLTAGSEHGDLSALCLASIGAVHVPLLGDRPHV